MKNTKLFPFERNKYYYGKLLSVEDFNLEQKYTNDKRRLMNRLLGGTGVVAGMNVVGIDEQTVSVERGLAIDATGREIVIDTPVTKKLSLIDGYDACVASGRDGYAYLYIEYDEQDKGAVHNVAGTNGENSAHNRIKEAYKLYLSANEPDAGLLKPEDLYEETTQIYWDGKIRIKQIIPKYVNPGESFEIRIETENLTKQYLSFSYDLQLTCLVSKKQSSLRVSFDESLYEKTGRYTLTYPVDVLDVVDTDGVAAVDASSFVLSLDRKVIEAHVSGKSVTRISAKDVKDAVTEEYYRTPFENILRNDARQDICLARILLVSAGTTCIIEDIEQVPFGQYVANNYLTAAIDKLLASGGGCGAENTGAAASQPVAEKHEREVASGVCRISLGVGGQKNQNFFSDEIIHGLGLGSVTIVLGLMEEDSVTFGASYIFAEKAPKLQLAAKLNPARGSFVIGARMMLATTIEYIDVKWTAIRDVEEKVREKNAMKIFIKPTTLMLKTRESFYLEAVCNNMTNKTVIWSAAENGGYVDANGMYTAPNIPGVYEVVAQSAAFPDIKASIMVVVRE